MFLGFVGAREQVCLCTRLARSAMAGGDWFPPRAYSTLARPARPAALASRASHVQKQKHVSGESINARPRRLQDTGV